MKTLIAWRGGLFLTEKKMKELSVSSLFLTWVGVYVGVCVYMHTHTHTAKIGYSDVSPGVGMRHLEGPKNPDGLISAYIYSYMCTKYTCVCIC